MAGDPSAPDQGDRDAPVVRAGDVREPLGVLRGADLRRWAALVARRLDRARGEIDALNVFPVADGDTGTNLVLTVRGAMADGSDDLVRALLVHARGSSGVIAAQLVRGWADELAPDGRWTSEAVGPGLVATALRRGDETAWAAVSDPVPGTVLSVSRASAEAAARVAASGASLHAVVVAVVEAAAAALARTPSQLPALAAAGVVDAGGAGLLLVFRALQDVVEGRDRASVAEAGAGVGRTTGTATRAVGADLDPAGPAYEVMYLLEVRENGMDDSADVSVDGLRRALHLLGDSVVVAGEGDLWHVHVHTHDPGAAVEAALVAGRPSAIRITHFAAARDAAPRPAPDQTAAPTTPLAAVAFAAGAATQGLCRAAGAVVVPSDPGARASPEDVLAAVMAAGAGAGVRCVLLLPDGDDTAALAEQACRLALGRGVAAEVAGSRAQVQVLAALAVLADVPDARSEAHLDAAAVDALRCVAAADALRSAEAAVAGCRYGTVEVATRPGTSAAGSWEVGDVVGTAGREVVAVGPGAVEVAVRVVMHLGGGTGGGAGPGPARNGEQVTGQATEQVTEQVTERVTEQVVERVTVVPGEGGAGVAAALRERLQSGGHLTVDVLGGGQPSPLLLLGCE